jgi:hypothetical protein
MAVSIHQVFFYAFLISLAGIFLAFRLPKENLYEFINKG